MLKAISCGVSGPFEIGFVWVCIGFVLGLFWHFIGFNWL